MNHARTCIVVCSNLLRMPKEGFEESVETHLKKDYFNYHIVYCEDLNSARKTVEACVREEYDFVIVAGGNEYINRLAELLVKKKTCMGIIPLGYLNGLASHLKINYPLLEDSFNSINRRTIKQIDTASLNEHFFVNIAGLGFDASLARKFENKKMPTGFSLLFSVMEEFRRAKKHWVRVLSEEEEYSGSVFWLIISNGKQYGDRLYINPRASISDGMLEVCMFKKPNWFELPFFLWNLIRKNDFPESRMIRMRGREFYIENNFPYLQVDGILMDAPAEIRVIADPQSLRILVNK